MSIYESERTFFDNVASKTIVSPISQFHLDRYTNPQHPTLFRKEMMFSLLPKKRPLRLLEIGCGEGVASVQLANCGVDVTGIDISPVSIEVARKCAELHSVDINFEILNVVDVDNLGVESYDVIWCDNILHHLAEPLESVLSKLWMALCPGGRFIACEPVQYSRWLKAVRKCVPVTIDVTPDEKPLGPKEFALIEKYFPKFNRRYYRILARIDVLTSCLPLIAFAARIDNLLFCIPGFKSLAGDIVVWAENS